MFRIDDATEKGVESQNGFIKQMKDVKPCFAT